MITKKNQKAPNLIKNITNSPHGDGNPGSPGPPPTANSITKERSVANSKNPMIKKTKPTLVTVFK
jgi:hypothetical protein